MFQKTTEVKTLLTLESWAPVDSGVRRHSPGRGGGTGWGAGLEWEIGTGRHSEGQMAGAGRSPGPQTRPDHRKEKS